ncbi:hypothetical protein TspCOW1_29400 [Thiohalobacter sp. COW1]|uniref:septal ring lytic transglycosylase RlpA family protein n=1 Tax=Thiohalobacter sp. COW1 TaxID=2795687 RepID=UPI001935A85D|nr:septal ring lytic transglycosylase RlpA family protein [Thiohalobacter sp. COW1]BCO32837.1 hypothetical protein TspCOW1_29400 [Thiohalobacter sp. COW1]
MSVTRPLLYGLIALLLSACGGGAYVDRDGAPGRDVDVAAIPDAVPRHEPRSRYGNPGSYEVFGKRYYVMDSSHGYAERGIASWYGTKFHGRRTSSGEPYDMYAMTAAHKSLPLPTYARVTNLRNGRSIVVKINDRGPFHEGRIIDLSYVAAKKLDIVATGTAPVEVVALNPGQSEPQLRSASAAPRPAVQPARNDNPDLYLQVGAFSSRHNAERLSHQLQDIDLPGIEIQQGYSDQRPVFRVRIGPLASIEDADRMAESLTRFGIQRPHVVVD